MVLFKEVDIVSLYLKKRYWMHVSIAKKRKIYDTYIWYFTWHVWKNKLISNQLRSHINVQPLLSGVIKNRQILAWNVFLGCKKNLYAIVKKKYSLYDLNSVGKNIT